MPRFAESATHAAKHHGPRLCHTGYVMPLLNPAPLTCLGATDDCVSDVPAGDRSTSVSSDPTDLAWGQIESDAR